MPITTVLVIKNRPEKQTICCIESLAKQLSNHCKIIVVDYGSTEENLIWERKLFDKFGVKLIEVKNNTQIFNKSRALNIGIRQAKTDFIMLGDIDNVYLPNFIYQIEKVLDLKRIITCRRININQDGSRNPKHIGAYGGCLVLSKDFLYSIRGLDEMFTLWGGEDDDLIERAIKRGLELYSIPIEVTHCIHQWHPKADKSKEKWNRQYLKIKKTVIRNLKIWGEI